MRWSWWCENYDVGEACEKVVEVRMVSDRVMT